MPVSCCAVNCTNCFKARLGIGFYIFPVNENKWKAWIRAVSLDKWQWTNWLAVLGKNSQQGVKLPPRMHLVRQILEHTYSVGGTCHCCSLSVTVLALCEGKREKTAEQLCGCMPVPFQLHMYKLRQQFHHVSSAECEQCMLSWPSEMQSGIPSQY